MFSTSNCLSPIMKQCKYCKSPENKQYKPCLTCKICRLSVHLDCLIETKTPGNFAGDVFFLYTCGECTSDGSETFEREKMTWLNCMFLIINDLTSKRIGISNKGYFHRLNQIGAFIYKHWADLFPPSYKQRKNWSGTVSGVLSTYSPLFFESGLLILKDSGWWKLAHKFSPSLYSHLASEINITKQKRRANKNAKESATEVESDYEILTRIATEMGFADLLAVNDLPIEKLNDTEEEVLPTKKQKLDPEYASPALNLLPNNEPDPTLLDKYFSNYFMDADDSLSDFDNLLPDFDEIPGPGGDILSHNDFGDSLQDSKSIDILPSKNINIESEPIFNHENRFSTSDDESQSFESEITFAQQKKMMKEPTENKTFLIQPPSVQSLFSKTENGLSLPWEKDNFLLSNQQKECTMPTTEYEEVQMLNHLNNLCRKAQFLDIDSDLVRLRAKLALRKLKRSKHMPAFNFDGLISRLANYPVQESSSMFQNNRRILDRFQDVSADLPERAMSQYNLSTRLIGYIEPSTFVSSYSGRVLKPYIRRDTETEPLWLRVMDELQNKVNAKYPSWVKPQRASLDYCYVRPQHIAVVNSLCAQFFWPGIDMTEVLQYPDFSCVVLYKKLIVGFTFLVPDVGPNEAYISFIFTRPEWRKAGIGNFMIYHLIQTCIGKDITLHVSPTNSAIFLYQKFGFKVEQLMQEFYDKFLPVESTECKHALFLRLCR